MLKTYLNTDLYKSIKKLLLLLLLTTLPKVLGLLKEILIARTFGVSIDVDNYILILAYITFPLSFYISGTQTFLIKKMKKSDEKNSKMLFESFLYLNILFGFLIIPIFLYTCLESLSFFSDISIYDFILLCSYYLVTSTNTLLYGYLQAKNKLNKNFLTPILSPIGFILILAVFEPAFSTLILALFISVFFELLFLSQQIRKKVSLYFFNLNYLITFKKNIKEWVGFCVLSFIPSFIPLILQLLFNTYGEGSISVISYSSKVPLAISGLLLTVVSVYTFTYIEELLENNLKNIKKKINQFQLIIFLLTIPISLVIIFFSKDIINLIYAGDKISSSRIIEIYRFQLIYLINIPFLVLNMFLWRCLVFLGITKKLVLISSISGIINVCLLLITHFYSNSLEYLVISNTVGLGLVNFILYKYFLKNTINAYSYNINASV